MAAPRYPRLPVAPLQGDDTLLGLARRLGVHNKQIHRWVMDGGVPFYAADVAAARLGCHPCELWHQAWWDACTFMSDHEAEARADQECADWLRRWLRTPAARERRALVREADAAERWRDRKLRAVA